MNKLLLFCTCICIGVLLSQTALSQCISSVPQNDIGCDNGPVTISATVPSFMSGAAGNIVWSNGVSGQSFTFTPNCSQLGPKTFTPCLGPGTPVPAQSFVLGPFSGNIPVGGTASETITVSNICFQPGVSTYAGSLALNFTGSGTICLSVILPDGTVQGPICQDIATINGLSPIPISLLGITSEPNGTWAVSIQNQTSGNVGYNISASTITIPAYSTQGFICADPPVDFYVFGGCPSFVSVSASKTQICAGEQVTLSALLNPAGAPNVSYQWTGPNGFSSTLPNPTVTPANTGCTPQTLTYTLQTLTCTNNGSLITSNRPVSVTVYPFIDPAGITYDNTSNIQDPDCSVLITSVLCPNFTINGQVGPVSLPVLPGDNGTNVNVSVSAGYAGCAYSFNVPVTCLSNCSPPVATLTSSCQGTSQYFVNVNVSAFGDASAYDIVPSQGNAITIAGIGSYQFGPYPNGTSVNIKILNSLDPNCNVNLGVMNYNCQTCPNLLTATASGASSRCAGDNVTLAATVSGGTLGSDYSIQWYKNGNPIAGANALSVNHVLSSSDYCNGVVQIFSAVIKCLNGGTEPSTYQLYTSPITVYNEPRFGVEFTVSECESTPADKCDGNLVINIGGAPDPAPGATTTVNYNVSVSGAPAGCAATGSYTVGCTACTDNPGDGVSTRKVVCWGETFEISNAGALAIKPGFKVGLAVSTQPITHVNSTADLIAQANIDILGPYNSPGAINPAEVYTNTNLNNLIPATGCGTTVYFTPFLSFQSQIGTVLNESGIISAPGAGGPFCGGDLPGGIVPGIAGNTLTLSNLPYCEGLSNYDISYRTTNSDNYTICPIDDQAVILGINVADLPGGITAPCFPSIDNKHDCGTTYLQDNFPDDPNTCSINTTIVIVPLTPWSCNETGHMSWNLQVISNTSSTFPTICPSCNSVGVSEAVTILPQVTLAAIPSQNISCTNTTFDLATLSPAPTPNIPGFYKWYAGNPNSGGTALDTTLVTITSSTQYCVEYYFCETGDCKTTPRCVTLQAYTPATINTPVVAPVCPGQSVNLTQYNSQVTTQSGTIRWYLGDPAADPPGALIANPNNVTPIGSEKYYVEYTNNSNCPVSTFIQFSYHPIPVLLAAAPTACAGQQVDLRDNEADLTTADGSFTWYTANPAAGGTLIPDNGLGQVFVTPQNGSTYWVTFINGTTGCSKTTSVTYTVYAPPTLAAPTPTGVCPGTVVSLTDLQSSITGIAGTFNWYNGNPNAGGTAISDPGSYTVQSGNSIYTRFTETATGCTNTINFTYPTYALPQLNATLPTPNNLCANGGIYNLQSLESLISSGAGQTFAWYKGSSVAAGTLLTVGALPPSNDPTQQSLSNGQSQTYTVLITNSNGCTASANIVYNQYMPVIGATATYNCATGLQVNLGTMAGGSGSGYHIAPTSPNTNGQILAHETPWTVLVVDNHNCQQTAITGVVDCPICEAGAAQSVSNNQLCCGETVTINNPTANLTDANRYTIAWGFSPTSSGPINNAASAQAAADEGWVFESDAGTYNFTYTHECFEGNGNIPAGNYYVTPFISKVPPQLGPPDPIVYDPANGCTPVGSVCPTLGGSDWQICDMFITFPDGTIVDVIAAATTALNGSPLNICISQTLLDGLPQLDDLDGDGHNDLPCIPISALYQGDPNGPWSISITNEGTGTLNFNLPDFEITVPASTCSQLSTDQVSFVAGISGQVAAGQTGIFNLSVPSPQVTIPVITYDPAAGCVPDAEICPALGGSGWEICDFFINFPDGSEVNVISTATEALTGTALNVCITPELLNGFPLPDLNGDGNNDLPCIDLGLLYQGNPNGVWEIRVNNTGGGALLFNLPSFDFVVDSCSLIPGQTEINTVDALTVVVPANTDTIISLQVPSLPQLFPALSDECMDFGTPTTLTLLDDITWDSATIECASPSSHVYIISLTGLNGGAPGVIPGATYSFPASTNYNALTDVYQITTVINSFPYTLNIGTSTQAGPAGSGCNSAQAVFTTDPCICVPAQAAFQLECLDGDQWRAMVILQQDGNSPSYNISDNQGSTPINNIVPNATTLPDTFYIGNYPINTDVIVKLTANGDIQCADITHTYTGVADICGTCKAGQAVLSGSNLVCCEQVLHIDLANENVINDDLDIIGWGISTQPITNEADIASAVLVQPGNTDYSYDFTNNCNIPAGNYYATPFISRAAGDPVTLSIPYNPTAGCVPNAGLMPNISGTDWVIDPLLIQFPDGSTKTIFEALGLPPIEGGITPPLWQTVLNTPGLLPLQMTSLYSGDPNGTWCLIATNIGSGALNFALEDFDVVVTCQGNTQTFPINGAAGVISPNSTMNICFEVNAGTIIPNFPEIDPLCTDFGQAVPLTIVNNMDYDFTIACNDANNDGLDDGYLATISNITGGAPEVIAGATYSIPSGFTQTQPGTYTRLYPITASSPIEITVGSTSGGVSSCSAAKSVALPETCITSCGLQTAFGAFCPPVGAGYFVNVNISAFGPLNSSYTISNSQNSTIITATAAGVYQAGPFTNGSNVTITVTGVQRPVCVASQTFTNIVCETCDAGVATAMGDNLACPGETITIDAANASIKPDNIVAWALASQAISDTNQLGNAIKILPSTQGSSLVITNNADSNIPVGVYQATPFMAQPAGDEICPQIPYDPAAGCIPQAGIMPAISGTGWIINPLIIHFPDGTSKDIFEAVGQSALIGTPITPSLWGVVVNSGLLPLQMTSIFAGNPNGEWCLEANNVGSGTLEFALEAFDVTVTCDGVLQTFHIEGVSGSIPGGTGSQVCFDINGGECYVPNFPTVNTDCNDFGTATQVILTNEIDYNLTAQCVDNNSDGLGDNFLLTVSNVTGGAPEVLASATYALPVGFVQSSPGIYTKTIPVSSTSPQTIQVGSSVAGDCAITQSVNLPPNCATPCTAPTLTATVVCNGITGFNVNVTLSGGVGNTSYTLSNNINSNTSTLAANGTTLVGPFAFGTNVVITATGVQFNQCSVSSTTQTLSLADCAECHIGLVSTDNNILCCGQSATVSVDDNSSMIFDGHILAYALSNTPVENQADLSTAIEVVPAAVTGDYVFESDCNLAAGSYYVTPLIAQTPGAEVCPEIPYDTLNNCIPQAGLVPQIGGTGWVINPLLIHFPDGTTKTIFDALGQSALNGTPINAGLWSVVVNTPGLLPLQMTTLYHGNPNGMWCLEATNVGTGALEFAIQDFDITVTCDGATQTFPIAGVSGIIPADTTSQICFEINAGCFLPDFPTIDPECADFGAAQEIYVLDPISYDNASVACFDEATNQYLVSISGLSGGAKGIIAGADYTFPETATYNAATNTYSFVATIPNPNAPYSFTVGNSTAGAGCTELLVNNLSVPTDCGTIELAPVVSPALLITYNDETANIDLGNYVQDGNNDPLTFSINTAIVEGGTLTYTPNGEVTFVPDEGYVGTVVVPFTVTDGNTAPVSGTLTIEVRPSCAAIPPLTLSITDFPTESAVSLVIVVGGGLPEEQGQGVYSLTVAYDNEYLTFNNVADTLVVADILPPATTFQVNVTAADANGCSITQSQIVYTVTTDVNWINFTGEVLPEGNYLKWATASETNNDFFAVQRAVNGTDFTEIGRVDGAGNSSLVKNYTFTDKYAPAGLSYYRLAQTDFDGTVSYSPIITLMRNETSNDNTFSIRDIVPVPASHVVGISFVTPQSGQVSLSLYDVTGKFITAQTIEARVGLNSTAIDISKLAAGVYFASLNNGIAITTGRIVKE